MPPELFITDIFSLKNYSHYFFLFFFFKNDRNFWIASAAARSLQPVCLHWACMPLFLAIPSDCWCKCVCVVCVCVCALERKRRRECVWVCAWERERPRERVSESSHQLIESIIEPLNQLNLTTCFLETYFYVWRSEQDWYLKFRWLFFSILVVVKQSDSSKDNT